MTLDDDDNNKEEKSKLDETGETKNESLEVVIKSEEASSGGSSSPGVKRPFDQMAATSPTNDSSQDGETLKCNETLDGFLDDNLLPLTSSGHCDKPSTSGSIIKSAPINFKVVFAKETYDITMDETDTVRDLKDRMSAFTGISYNMQKLCFRGALQDNKTLKDSSVKNGVKILMVGSKINEVLTLNNTPKQELVEEKQSEKKEPLCQQTAHKKLLEKGKPDYALPAWSNVDAALPPEPLTGMMNKYGLKTRLTFKLETDELWIGTKVRTTKLQMSTIKSVISEPIEGSPEYHMLGIQIGPTEQSRLWFYWVPAQYIKAIKTMILG